VIRNQRQWIWPFDQKLPAIFTAELGEVRWSWSYQVSGPIAFCLYPALKGGGVSPGFGFSGFEISIPDL
jgi:hypothetical protein